MGYAKVAKKGEKVQPQADAVSFDPAWASLPFGDNSILFDKLIRRLAEGLFRGEKASAVFPAQLKTPILGDLFSEAETFLLRAGSALFAADRCRALPETTVVASVNLNLSSNQRVAFHRLT